jgi:hypothetical protein
MKIRTGFVSNSSSSSFVIRGFEISTKKLAQAISEKDPEGWDKVLKEDREWQQKIGKKESIQDLFDAMMSYNFKDMKKSDKLQVESMVDFFDDSDHIPTKLIVGVELVDLEDGQVTKLPTPDDVKVLEVIERLTGLKPEKLETYIQFVSNDNY